MNKLPAEIANLKPEEFPEEYQDFITALGLDGFIKLLENFNGEMIYVPRLKSFMANIKHKKILAEFDGYNHKELANKYGLTERWTRRIISEAENKLRS